MANKKENFDKYLKTYYGKALMQKHSFSDYGLWKISGEDPNADMGGHHHMPNLGYVEGQLKDVLYYGCSLSDFWTWGGGGSFELIVVKKVGQAEMDNKRKLEIQAEMKKLQKELSSL